jgi:hypothetical protein
MRFLRRCAVRGAAESATPSADVDPIAVFTIDGVSEGWTIRGPDRLSDDLNRGVPIRVRYGDDGPWNELSTDSSVAIAAPPRARSANRIARRHHALDLTAPPYRIHGVVHMPHGADPTRYLRAAPQKWIAVTDSTIVTGPDGDGFEIDVLLVNMDYVARP